VKRTIHSVAATFALSSIMLTPLSAHAHGDVAPHSVDTQGLTTIGDKWLNQNPYQGNETALRIGTSAFGQNCARCHGLDAISGGIAPDLRRLDRDCFEIKNEAKKQACYKDTDNYFIESIRKGKVRNGAVYMPPFEGILNQEAMWAVKTYLESRRETK
jgi:cytochrome c-550 PedF